jgi:hypothetical protein
MYQALRFQQLTKILVAAGVLIFILFLWYAPPDSLTGWPSHLASAVTVTGLLIAALGSKWVFRPFWQLKPVQAFLFPYIAGEWTGTISSNWPVSKAMKNAFVEGGGAHPESHLDIEVLGTEDKSFKVTIEADLFRVTMKLETSDKYSSSHTIFVRPQLHGPQGRPRLFYLYQNDTPVPFNTDSASHVGAAYLDVTGTGENMVMEGTYWTARNWTKGLNTAGRITLRRSLSRNRSKS